VARLQREGIRERERSMGEGSGDNERGRDGKDMVVKIGKGIASYFDTFCKPSRVRSVD